MRNENYVTDDYGLANWLVYNKVTLLGAVAYPNEQRKKFVFLPTSNIDELLIEWQTPTTDVANICKRFFTSHTVIKKALKESMDIA